MTSVVADAATSRTASTSPAAAASRPLAGATLTLDRFRSSPSRVVLANGETAAASDRIEVTRTWNGEWCASTIVNRGSRAVRIKEVVLFSVAHDLPPDRMALLQKLLPPTGVAAEFDDASLTVGVMRGVPRASNAGGASSGAPASSASTASGASASRALAPRTYVVFNWENTPSTMTVKLGGSCALTDFWTGDDLGRHRGVFTIDKMPPHSARLLICRPVN